MKDHLKVAVIGGGPAGIAASIQLKRYSIAPILLFEQDQLGGLVKNAYSVENYLGFKKITGKKLINLFKEHIKNYDVEVRFEKVKRLEYLEKDKLFLITTNNSSYFAEKVIVSSGTVAKKLNHLIEQNTQLKDYIFYEIYPFMKKKNKKIIIIGAGDIAFDYALSLAKKNEILILNRSNRIKALPQLAEKVLKNPNIKYYSNALLKSVDKNKNEKALQVSVLLKENKHITITANYIFIAIGRLPQKDFYSDYLTEKEKYLQDKGLLYLAGDVKGTPFRQVAIAVADGITAAMKIFNSLCL